MPRDPALNHLQISKSSHLQIIPSSNQHPIASSKTADYLRKVYSKQEKSKLQQEFWTTLGKYLSPIPSAEGLKINWINYKTGVKGVRFFMETDGKKASIGIKLIHDDIEIQQLFFEEFKKLNKQMIEHMEEDWIWHLHATDENGATVSLIYKEQQPVNVYDQSHWPQIISFLKPRMLALDTFWCNWKYGFEELS